MNQLARITHMEQILNDAAEASSALLAAIKRYQALKPRIAELEAYYTSSLWMRDYEDDCAGKLPPDLRRGVLSEDAVYNLLSTQSELREYLKD